MTIVQPKKPSETGTRLELSERYKRIYEEAVRRTDKDEQDGLEYRIGASGHSEINLL